MRISCSRAKKHIILHIITDFITFTGVNKGGEKKYKYNFYDLSVNLLEKTISPHPAKPVRVIWPA